MISSLNSRVGQIQAEVGEITRLTESPEGKREDSQKRIKELDEMAHRLFDTGE